MVQLRRCKKTSWKRLSSPSSVEQSSTTKILRMGRRVSASGTLLSVITRWSCIFLTIRAIVATGRTQTGRPRGTPLRSSLSSRRCLSKENRASRSWTWKEIKGCPRGKLLRALSTSFKRPSQRSLRRTTQSRSKSGTSTGSTATTDPGASSASISSTQRMGRDNWSSVPISPLTVDPQGAGHLARRLAKTLPPTLADLIKQSVYTRNRGIRMPGCAKPTRPDCPLRPLDHTKPYADSVITWFDKVGSFLSTTACFFWRNSSLSGRVEASCGPAFCQILYSRDMQTLARRRHMTAAWHCPIASGLLTSELCQNGTRNV
jgi:hypothetical protein